MARKTRSQDKHLPSTKLIQNYLYMKIPTYNNFTHIVYKTCKSKIQLDVFYCVPFCVIFLCSFATRSIYTYNPSMVYIIVRFRYSYLMSCCLLHTEISLTHCCVLTYLIFDIDCCNQLVHWLLKLLSISNRTSLKTIITFKLSKIHTHKHTLTHINTTNVFGAF